MGADARAHRADRREGRDPQAGAVELHLRPLRPRRAGGGRGRRAHPLPVTPARRRRRLHGGQGRRLPGLRPAGLGQARALRIRHLEHRDVERGPLHLGGRGARGEVALRERLEARARRRRLPLRVGAPLTRRARGRLPRRPGRRGLRPRDSEGRRRLCRHDRPLRRHPRSEHLRRGPAQRRGRRIRLLQRPRPRPGQPLDHRRRGRVARPDRAGRHRLDGPVLDARARRPHRQGVHRHLPGRRAAVAPLARREAPRRGLRITSPRAEHRPRDRARRHRLHRGPRALRERSRLPRRGERRPDPEMGGVPPRSARRRLRQRDPPARRAAPAGARAGAPRASTPPPTRRPRARCSISRPPRPPSRRTAACSSAPPPRTTTPAAT